MLDRFAGTGLKKGAHVWKGDGSGYMRKITWDSLERKTRALCPLIASNNNNITKATALCYNPSSF